MEEIQNWDLRSWYTAESTPSTLSQPATIKADAVNYTVRVQWKDATGTTNLHQVMTTEGEFKMDTIQPHSV